MILIVSNLRFVSKTNFMLSCIEHENFFINLVSVFGRKKWTATDNKGTVQTVQTCSLISITQTCLYNFDPLGFTGYTLFFLFFRSDCADRQTDLGLHCLHMSKDTFLHVTAQILLNSENPDHIGCKG